MPWEDVVENSNSDDTIPTFWDTVDVKPKDVTMALIDCPHCQRRLRVPEDYVGRLTCASCNKEFHRPNEQNQNTSDCQSGYARSPTPLKAGIPLCRCQIGWNRCDGIHHEKERNKDLCVHHPIHERRVAPQCTGSNGSS